MGYWIGLNLALCQCRWRLLNIIKVRVIKWVRIGCEFAGARQSGSVVACVWTVKATTYFIDLSLKVSEQTEALLA